MEIKITDEQIAKMGRYWKKQLNSPFREDADKDFSAGITWLKNLLNDPRKQHILDALDKEDI